MNILLLSMPDSFEHMPPVAIRMPNGALGSLAGNVDPHHRVAVADLILVQGASATTVERLVREHAPDVVGPVGHDVPARTALAHHRSSCARCARRAHRRGRLRPEPGARGLHRARARRGLHRARRGRGDVSRAGARHRARRASSAEIAGLSFRDGDEFLHNPDRAGRPV